MSQGRVPLSQPKVRKILDTTRRRPVNRVEADAFRAAAPSHVAEVISYRSELTKFSSVCKVQNSYLKDEDSDEHRDSNNQLTIDEEVLKKASSRYRNQLVGCMHAHNELAVLNRILMFSMNRTADGELHNSAQFVQEWCLLQVLAGKLVETWNMLHERFLKAQPEDPALARLTAAHKGSLDWLKDYFGVDGLKDNTLRMIRDKTAFHYDKLNLEQALSNFAEHENTVYLAQHPSNSVYYAGSVLVFRTAFAMIADSAQDPKGSTFGERTVEGFRITSDDVKLANWHMHLLLYGLIETLLEEILACPLETLEHVRINVPGAPDPAMVGLPTFIAIGDRAL